MPPLSVSTAPIRLHFEPLDLLSFDFNADPDPDFHSSADSDPASKNNTDLCGSGPATLQGTIHTTIEAQLLLSKRTS
jgi:hypothetical protein